MDHCEARKAFDSLWSITDEVFKYVADIRTILDGAKGPESEILPSDPPSYENSMPEQLFERLNQEVTCLENLNEKRKALLEEFTTAIKNDDLDEKKQVREKPSGGASVSARDSALKSLLSYTRARQAALTTNLYFMEQVSQYLSGFRHVLGGGQLMRGYKSDSQRAFYDVVEKCADLDTHMNSDKETILREGKMLEEAILKVPHETDDETSKILKELECSHRQIKSAKLFKLSSNISPFLTGYLATRTIGAMKEDAISAADNVRRSFTEYTQMVERYSQALQSLADHLIV